MKLKSIKFTLMAAAATGTVAAMMPSCSSETVLPAGEGNAQIEAQCIAPIDITGSRTSIDPTEYADGVIGINWEPTDRIGVFGDQGTANAEFANSLTSAASSATFTGTLKSGETAEYAYYPYSANAGTDPTALRGTLPAEQAYDSSTGVLQSDWKVSRKAPEANVFKFDHLFSFFRFRINAGGTEIADEKLWSIALTIDGKQLGGDFTYNFVTNEYSFAEQTGYSTLKMNWTDRPALNAGTFYGYMTVRPVDGIAGKTMEVKITTSEHIATFPITIRSTVDRLQRNCYYTLALDLERYAADWKLEANPDAKEENAAWVPGLESRLACANTVFALPGKPFMHKIRVPENPSATAHAVVPTKTGVKRAYNLPEGLTWNAERCLVEGTAPAAGEYTYSVEFEIGGQTYREGIRLTVSDNLVSPTPMMGWQSWNVLKDNISETIIKNQADALVSLGLREAGYKYIGIDDCWQVKSGRDSQSRQIPDASKFPNGMKSVTDYLHGLGLKAGIYSDAGTVTCEGYEASYSYEATDAQAYADWGFDMLKEDWFWGGHGDNNGKLDHTSTALARELYGKMGDGIASSGRQILLYMCEWGTHDPWKWAAEVGSSCWRMSYDARDGWWGSINNSSSSKNNDTNANGVGLHNTIVLMRNLWPYVGINRYNDADMLCIGIRGTGQSSNDCVYGVTKSTNIFTGKVTYKKDGKTYTGMSDTEYETNFAMWCMYSSPLLLSIDMTRSDLNTHDLAIMKNKELIAINQDALGQGAEFIKSVDGIDYYQKDLANGDVAIAVVNLNDNSANYNVSIADYDALDRSATYTARNILKSSNTQLSASSDIRGSLDGHGTVVYRLSLSR